MLNPVDDLYALREILERLRVLELFAAEMASRRVSEFHRGEVTVTGGAQCEVEMLDGSLRTFGYLESYSPLVGDQVLVALSPAWSGVLGKVSV